MRYLFPTLLFSLLLFFLWQSLQQNPGQIPSPLINKPLPHFVATSLADRKKTFTEKLFTKHLSLLVVWSSWCIECREEQIFLLNLKKKQQIPIFGLNYRDKATAAKQWLKQYGNPFNEIIFDPHGLLGINLGVYGVPESFLLDAKGIIRYKHIGPLTEWIWLTQIQALLH
jgi:cytochrome c biogenesis protein CcmG, thiol:disulfide interchange protein DsbE